MAERTNDGGTNLVTLPGVVGLVLVALSIPGYFVLRRFTGSAQPATVEQSPAPSDPATPPDVPTSASGPAARVRAAAGKPNAAEKPGTLARPRAAVTLTGVKVVVAGRTLKEHDAILMLADDRLSLLDRSTKAALLSLPYRSIDQAFYSRSRQPQWKGANGRTETAKVDLGGMGFLRGQRHWLILTARSRPVFISLDRDVPTALLLIEERIGVRIQR